MELVVQPVVHPCREERDALQQARDVRIVDRIGRQAQPTGDFRVRVGELRGKPAQRYEFAIVVGKQCVRHRPAIARQR